jgi:hypothetical protein
MTKMQLKEYIENLKTDIKFLENDPEDFSHLENVLKFLQQVKRVFNYEIPPTDNEYSRGFRDGIKQVESEIFDEEK